MQRSCAIRRTQRLLPIIHDRDHRIDIDTDPIQLLRQIGQHRSRERQIHGTHDRDVIVDKRQTRGDGRNGSPTGWFFPRNTSGTNGCGCRTYDHDRDISGNRGQQAVEQGNTGHRDSHLVPAHAPRRPAGKNDDRPASGGSHVRTLSDQEMP